MISILELNQLVNKHKCNQKSQKFWEEKENCKNACYEELTNNAKIGIKKAEIFIPSDKSLYQYWDAAIAELRYEGFNVQVDKSFTEYYKIFIWYI